MNLPAHIKLYLNIPQIKRKKKKKNLRFEIYQLCRIGKHIDKYSAKYYNLLVEKNLLTTGFLAIILYIYDIP